MPRVSVIVPNYNHANFLKQRLDTVLGQTFTDFEVLLLDDASTDSSIEVFKLYVADPRIRVFLNEVNSGSPFKQWNRGLDLAVGEYVWIAESDDFADTKFLQKLVAVLDSNPDAGMAYCQSFIVQVGESALEPTHIKGWYARFEDHERWEQDFKNSGRNELANYMVYKNTIPNASAVLFRKSVLSDGLRAPENMRLAGDWMFWVKILQRSDLAFLSEPLNFFRTAHAGSQRSQTSKHCLELIEGLDVYEFIDRTAQLDAKTKPRVLHDQVQLWAGFAYTRRLAWRVNRDIYRKVLNAHPEIVHSKWQKVILPFIYFFVGTPLKRIRPLSNAVRAIKKTMGLCIDSLRHEKRAE